MAASLRLAALGMIDPLSRKVGDSIGGLGTVAQIHLTEHVRRRWSNRPRRPVLLSNPNLGLGLSAPNSATSWASSVVVAMPRSVTTVRSLRSTAHESDALASDFVTVCERHQRRSLSSKAFSGTSGQVGVSENASIAVAGVG